MKPSPMASLIAHSLVKIGDQYLLTKRTKIKRGEPNVYPEYWDIPGGRVEVGETPRTAAIRETKEEVNLDVNLTKIIYEDSHFDEQKGFIWTRLVYGSTLKDNFNVEEVKLDPEEHSEFKLINSLEDLKGEKIVPFVIEVIEQDLKNYGN